jgi:SAM-dependent methyltransferase
LDPAIPYSAQALPQEFRPIGRGCDRTVTGADGYLLDNQHAAAARRIDALSAIFDPSTFRHMVDLGLSPGWRVWEVGAGGPGVPRWLVGPDGYVLATDIDISGLEGERSGFPVSRHDIGADAAPGTEFDMVHARLVLVHVPRRDHALETMIDAVRPGGWVFVEDADPGLQSLACPDQLGEREQLANMLKDGFRSPVAAGGADLAFGRTLPRRLHDAGLIDVGADAFVPIGGTPSSELELATINQIGDRLVERGLATRADLDAHVAHVMAGDLDLVTSPMISAWGMKPPA